MERKKQNKLVRNFIFIKKSGTKYKGKKHFRNFLWKKNIFLCILYLISIRN
jgi:hypothetical protein